MNDLLGAVKGNNALYNGAEDDGDVEEHVTPPPTDSEREMQEFFKNVEQIRTDLAEIKELESELLSLHEQGKGIVRSKELKMHREVMQERINAVNKLAHGVKCKIEALDKQNEAAESKKGQEQGTASERTRTTVTAGLKKKLKDLMQEFSNLRTRIQADHREEVQRQVYAVCGKQVAEEEIDAMIENGTSERIYQEALLQPGRGRVLDTLAEIEERNRAMKDLEQSLLQLHQIFLDMAVLVEAQGEMLDNIEKQVARSVSYVKGGTEAMQDAKQLQKNTRKWMCCGIITVLIIIIIIVLAVVQPWQYVH